MIRRPPRSTLSLHDALPISRGRTAATAHGAALLVGLANYLLIASVPRLAQTPESTGYGFGTSVVVAGLVLLDRKSTRLNSSHANISYAVFCLKKKQIRSTNQ